MAFGEGDDTGNSAGHRGVEIIVVGDLAHVDVRGSFEVRSRRSGDSGDSEGSHVDERRIFQHVLCYPCMSGCYIVKVEF